MRVKLLLNFFLRRTHLKNHHQGIDYLRSKVQERYAILKLRSTLRSIKSNCVLCRRFRAATIQTIMADLPKERLAYQSPPFTNTGLITSAHSTSQFVGLPRRGGDFSSHVSLLVLSMLKSSRPWTLVRV